MYRTTFALIGLVILGLPVSAQTYKDGGGTVIQGVRPTYLYSSAGPSQMGLSVAAATNLMVPAGTTIAQICVEGAGVRYRDDGIAPTALLGIPVAAGSCFSYSGIMTQIQFVAQSGAPTIDVSFYK